MSDTYNNIPIPMDSAGELIVNQRCNLIHFVVAEDSTGQADLDAKLEISPLATEDRFIPFFANTQLRYATERFKVRWEARAGVTAYLFVADAADVDISSPPAKQLITASLANAIAVSAATIDTEATSGTAQLLVAANGTRQSLLVQNLGTDDIYIGPTGTDASDGIRIEPGGFFSEEKTTAAIYAVADTVDGQDVRVWEAS